MSTSKRAPRYLEVASALEAEISNLSPNGLLLTEKQLAERYDVSRVTIRGALDLLEKSGLISRMRGRGTIVSPPKVTRRFAPLFSFEQDLESQGIEFTTRILSYERKSAPTPSVRQRLELPSRSSVGCLALVRIVFDRVVCHERRHYPPQIAARINANTVADQGASKVLEQLAQAQIAEVDWESEIKSPDGDVASALDVAPRTLVLENNYTWRLANGTPVEAGTVSYRVDRCKFRYELSFSHARLRSSRDRAGGNPAGKYELLKFT